MGTPLVGWGFRARFVARRVTGRATSPEHETKRNETATKRVAGHARNETATIRLGSARGSSGRNAHERQQIEVKRLMWVVRGVVVVGVWGGTRVVLTVDVENDESSTVAASKMDDVICVVV